jgi:hypothetical protein
VRVLAKRLARRINPDPSIAVDFTRSEPTIEATTGSVEY